MTAEQRAGLSDAALAMTQPCIDELIRDVSRHIKKAGAITDTAEYQIYRAQALGESKSAIEKAVAKQLDINEEVINSLFEYVADKSLTLDENGSLRQMTEGYERMSKAKTAEMLRDLWADTPEGKVLPLQTAYKKAMDFAFRQVATGSLDFDTVIRRAVTPLAKRGLNMPAADTLWTSWGSWTMKSSRLTTMPWGVMAGKSAPMQPVRQTTNRYRDGNTVMLSTRP